MAFKLVVCITLLIQYVPRTLGGAISDSIVKKLPECDTLAVEANDYDIFSLPGEFYTVTAPLPVDLRREANKALPYMKEFYTALQNPEVDMITMIGYWDNPQSKPNVTLVFGDAEDGVSFYLYVRDGQVYVPENTFANDPTIRPYDLPQDFAISLEFGIDGVRIEIADIYDEDNPVMKLRSTCVPYRAIPMPGISHMAIFTDCASVEFEMINIMFHNNNLEQLVTTKVVYSSDVPFKPNVYYTIFPKADSSSNEFHNKLGTFVYTGFSNSIRDVHLYGTFKVLDTDYHFCYYYYDCYAVYKPT